MSSLSMCARGAVSDCPAAPHVITVCRAVFSGLMRTRSSRCEGVGDSALLAGCRCPLSALEYCMGLAAVLGLWLRLAAVLGR